MAIEFPRGTQLIDAGGQDFGWAGLWPRCEQLLEGGGDTEWIAYSGSGAALELLMQFPEIGGEVESAWSDGRAVMFVSGSCLPESLELQLPVEWRALLSLPQPADVLLVPRERLLSAGPQRVVETVLQQGPLLRVLRRGLFDERLPGLTAGPPVLKETALRAAVRQTLQRTGSAGESLTCREAGLLLLHGFDDACHNLVQTLEGRGALQTADYWHGIMHRREPDAGNASWWFRRVRRHPVLQKVGEHLIAWLTELGAESAVLTAAGDLLDERGWLDPQRLTQLSMSALRDRGHVSERTARLVQYLEMVSLLTL